MNDQSIVEKILKNLDINPKIFFQSIEQEQIKNDLKIRTDDAIKNGVFGVPTYFVNNKIFWGQDRLEFAINEAKK